MVTLTYSNGVTATVPGRLVRFDRERGVAYVRNNGQVWNYGVGPGSLTGKFYVESANDDGEGE